MLNEKKVSEMFVDRASEMFDLYPECWLRNPLTGRSFRIDFIGFHKQGELLGPIGFEVKDPSRWQGVGGKFTEFTSAIAQCEDYQQMLISQQFSNPAHAVYFNHRLRFTFLVPIAPEWAMRGRASQEKHAMWAFGQLRLAGKHGVGAAVFDDRLGLTLTLATETAFSEKYGISALFTKHAVATRAGSSR